jgi:hypothetical protein
MPPKNNYGVARREPNLPLQQNIMNMKVKSQENKGGCPEKQKNEKNDKEVSSDKKNKDDLPDKNKKGESSLEKTKNGEGSNKSKKDEQPDKKHKGEGSNRKHKGESSDKNTGRNLEKGKRPGKNKEDNHGQKGKEESPDKEKGENPGKKDCGANPGKNKGEIPGKKNGGLPGGLPGNNKGETIGNSTGFEKGRKGTCKIGVVGDRSFAQAYGNTPGGVEQFVKNLVSKASDNINSEFGISLSIDSFQLENGLSTRSPQNGQVRSHLTDLSENIENVSNLCFVLGLTSTVIPGIQGSAPVGQACKGGLVVVRIDPEQKEDSIVYVMTHEAGHMLGANHDFDPTCKGKVQGDFVMGYDNRNPDKNPNAFKFSQCSKESILAKLPTYQCIN